MPSGLSFIYSICCLTILLLSSYYPSSSYYPHPRNFRRCMSCDIWPLNRDPGNEDTHHIVRKRRPLAVHTQKERNRLQQSQREKQAQEKKSGLTRAKEKNGFIRSKRKNKFIAVKRTKQAHEKQRRERYIDFIRC